MIMTLIEPIKKGGPYTHLEQLERKMQVFHLHYEEKKPALKIAEILNVNRNTVSEDIKFWYKQLDLEPNGIDITAKLIDQVHRMERQRNRLEDCLEKTQTIDDIFKLEKQISEADIRLVQFYSKAFFNGAELNNANFRSATLDRADFVDSISPKADFRNADLELANFNRANMQESSLYGANLFNAFLEGTDLQYADLQHSEFIRANLAMSNLDGAILNNTDFSEVKNLPITKTEAKERGATVD